ncbi:MAG: N-acetyl-gamma-glutamyl-phosphate reductase [Oscillospiraceae bacterium]|nr:N-acetyl-gamma-glutamyl-phosphate reductase [Oscillospiraceae bacterium]
MKSINVFVDGGEGTTGLQIRSRLKELDWVVAVEINETLRKNPDARRACMKKSKVVFLCLPDEAAREAVAMSKGLNLVFIDSSTAHRTDPEWAYGLPELSPEYRTRIQTSDRITVPGCHASGFSALVYPLRQKGLIDADSRLFCTSLTGYSGGGRSLIAEYQSRTPPRGALPYALDLKHKHMPEIMSVCQLEHPPIFQPTITPVKNGMLLSVPLAVNAEVVHEALHEWYARNPGQISVRPLNSTDALEKGRLNMEALNGSDKMELFVFGDENQAIMFARLDNLGKGAAGAAMECLRLRLGM